MKLDFMYNKNVLKDSIKNCVAGEKTYLLHLVEFSYCKNMAELTCYIF